MPDTDTTLQGSGQGDEVRSNLAAVYTRRAAALVKQGRLEDALNDFDKAIDAYDLLVLSQGHSELRGDLAEAYARRAELLRDLGRLEQALADLDAAVQLREKLVIVEPSASMREALAADLNIRGNVLSDLGQLDEAVRDFETAIEIGESLLRSGPAPMPARRQLPPASDHAHRAESKPRAQTSARNPIPLRERPAEPTMSTSRADARREERHREREKIEREARAVAAQAAQNAEGDLSSVAAGDVSADSHSHADEQGSLSKTYPDVARPSEEHPSPPAPGPTRATPRPARARSVVVRPVAKVESGRQEVVSYVEGVAPGGQSKPGRYVVIARDTGLGLVNKFWITTNDIAAEVQTLRDGGVRIEKVVSVRSYYGKRVGLVAAAVLLIASGTVIAMMGGRGGHGDAKRDSSAATSRTTPSLSNSVTPSVDAVADDATRAEMARALGRKPPTPEEISAEEARIRREAGIKGDPDSSRAVNSGEDEDIFDLLSPRYVPKEFRQTDK